VRTSANLSGDEPFSDMFTHVSAPVIGSHASCCQEPSTRQCLGISEAKSERPLLSFQGDRFTIIEVIAISTVLDS
jgi:hypothetical protein